MSVGRRVFIFTSEKVTPLPQEVFWGAFYRHEPTLKLYAGQIINVAIAIYKLKNRRPDQIITIDTMRLKVDENGACDSAYMNNYKRLLINRLPVWSSSSRNNDDISTPRNVIDAIARFNQKEWEALHPKLPGLIQKQILEKLFPEP